MNPSHTLPGSGRYPAKAIRLPEAMQTVCAHFQLLFKRVSLVRAAASAMLIMVLQLLASGAMAQTTVALAQVPLLALKSAPGLVMMAMSRDHRLFYAAYTDNNDLNGDGVLDVGFKPNITYYGYFVSNRCYAYDSVNDRFSPKAVALSADACKTVSSGSARWHGNWLNWVATSRMDALRRVLYGGYRVIDPASGVSVLEAASVPADSHIWGKEFRPPVGGVPSSGPDSYDISHYTALSAPSATTRQHAFMVKSSPVAVGVTTLNPPNLRIAANVSRTTGRVWNWTADERPIGKDTFAGVTTTTDGTSSFRLRVEVCVSIGGARESECSGYPATAPTVWKPTGLLHTFSDQDSLKFGLITGSYLNNYSGGVVRKDIGSFSDEFSASNGVYVASVKGIVQTINSIRNFGFYTTTPSNAALQQTPGAGTHEYLCGFHYASLRNQGACHMWGAPVAEMMYEGLRYFNAASTTSGIATPTSVFVQSPSGLSVGSTTSPDTLLGLPTKTSWLNPFRPKSTGGSPTCSRPVLMAIADPLTSFDTDQLPGAHSAFATPAPNSNALLASDKTIIGLNVSTEADAIWNSEFGAATKNFFIGQSGAVQDGNPTAKSATSFANMRGHAPDETLSQGGYYAASVARFGQLTGIKAGPAGTIPTANTRVDTIAVALGSTVPPISLTYLGQTAAVVPVLKTVSGSGVNAFSGTATSGSPPHQETGAITAFFVDLVANTNASDTDATVNSGFPYKRFLVSFSNAGQGTDNETDLSAFYILRIDPVSKNLLVEINHFYEAAGRISTLGYVISGTTSDGLYQEVIKIGATGVINYLDTRPGQAPAPVTAPFRHNTVALPVGVAGATVPQVSRAFSFGSATAGAGTYVPHDALWYAAKYGGPRDQDGNPVMNSSGDPVNYFKVTSPATLPDQMGKAFRSAAALAAVASTSVVGVGQRSLGTAAIYQANYDSLTWSSRLYAFQVENSGAVSNTRIWDAADKIGAPAVRTKLFLGRGGTSTPHQISSGGYSGLSSSGSPSEQADFGSVAIYEYLLGEKSGEERKGGTMRSRGTTAGAEFGSVLGDIVNSDPQIISKKDYGYTDSDASYATFLLGLTTESLAVGANAGFFHIFDALPQTTGGGELFSFIPQAARTNLKDLASVSYAHRYFVDGSIGQGHAKIKVPDDSTDNWRTIVIGTGGAGAKTVFAINARNDQTYSASSVLWEINANTTLPTASSLGNVVGRPAIGKLSNGTWVAVFGNGYNSVAGTASLLVVNLETGAIIRQLNTNNALTGNGLGSTEVVRKTSGNKDTIEYVYAADYKGNIWRFDLSASSAASWASNGTLVYTTPSGRPITAEIKVSPLVGAGAKTGNMIHFGTGSFLNSGDVAGTTVQALYGVFDDLLGPTGNTVPWVAEADLSSFTINMASAASDVRKISAVATPWYNITGKKGWVLPLTGTNVAVGERVIAPPVRYTVAGKVDAYMFTSIVPSIDECVAGVDAWITGVDAMTGGYAAVFDGLNENSVKVSGGSPRGVFVLQDGGDPVLYISQTVFNGVLPTTSYSTTTGGVQTVNINGTAGQTQVLGIKLAKQTATAARTRQSWRQLK